MPAPTAPWSGWRRLSDSLPIFIILIGLLVSVSNLTTVPWNNEPTGRTIAMLTDDTAITFDASGGGTDAAEGVYEVEESAITVTVRRDGTQVGAARETKVDAAADGTAGAAGDAGAQTGPVVIPIQHPNRAA